MNADRDDYVRRSELTERLGDLYARIEERLEAAEDLQAERHQALQEKFRELYRWTAWVGVLIVGALVSNVIAPLFTAHK